MIREALSLDNFYDYIDEIESFDAMEIYRQTQPDGSLDLLIPYVMNDSVECILRIKDCHLSGQWMDGAEKEAFFLEDYDTDDLIISFAEDHLVSIGYTELWMEGNCYQYHQIGHSWRKKAGEEQLRRLVNLLCVLHDKYSYLGEEFCNKEEMSLVHLMEFSPLASWSPINDSILDWYPETEDGTTAMMALVKEAKDMEYLSWLEEYASPDLSPARRELLFLKLYQELQQVSHASIYHLLLDKLEKASLAWPQRNYGSEEQEKMDQARQELVEEYRAKGYEGNFPRMRHWNHQNGRVEEVHFVEEFPFTMLEWEHYHYRIYAMESSYPITSDNSSKAVSPNNKVDCPISQKDMIPDYGFFLGQGNKSNQIKVYE